MSLWRLRITMSDDPHSRKVLTEALAGQLVHSRLTSSGPDAKVTADVVIEMPDVGGLGAMLGELHMISPQVFVSSADPAVSTYSR
jgi:hypothetical protein